MTYAGFEKKITEEPKALTESKIYWSAYLAYVPLLGEVLNQIAASPILPPGYAAVIGAVGGLLVQVFRRYSKSGVYGFRKVD